jgi:hypothetical protein
LPLSEGNQSAQTQKFVAKSGGSQNRFIGESFAELQHRRLETLAPEDFLDDMEKLLITLGLSGSTRIEVNNDSIPESGQMLRNQMP